MNSIKAWLLNLVYGDPSRWLKKATAHHDAGRFDRAVKCLRKAYRATSKGETSYPVETFLRLPLYLQKAGRFDEAWSEFHKLITDGYPNQLNDEGVRMMERAVVFDKMRLALQRQGNVHEAVAYGVCSRVAEVAGLCLQCRASEVARLVSDESISALASKLQPSGAVRASALEVGALLIKRVDLLPDLNVEEIVGEIRRIFSIPN